ncbi:family 43 glycosylhydrolase [Flavihumibacter sp. UBA7668]|uniref:family 43 glycosylhydrolase n=1 Tax=Flavihumibacter sp. UBA7668 TaxID=1946542 RepID=UPI0025C66C71|nr:family 43 glycosylhydrolase [Flavihumibacter sp. UBA7668]
MNWKKIALLAVLIYPVGIHAQSGGYLFTYFTGNGSGEEAIRFALSRDGYRYRALNANQAVIPSEKISSTGGVRDPHIVRGPDGKTFYMVVTDMVSANGWNSNRAMVLLKSGDLLNWTSSVVNIQKRFPGNDSLLRVWAPQTIYDKKAGRFMIYFSMKHGAGPDIIYYAYANEDFTDLATRPEQLFYHPSNDACIDGDIIEKDGRFHLFFKTEGKGAGIKKAVSGQLTKGYVLEDRYLHQTMDPVEGSGIFQLKHSKEWILMYDVYTKGRYQFTKSADLENFRVIDDSVSLPFHPRHGTVLPINESEYLRLEAKWGTNNPVLPGYYADPSILFSEKLQRFYLYPTSDGYTNWSGTSFKTFSSPDLVNWKEEGVILDLPTQVSWGKRNAWAPSILEKKINGEYKYFFYFTAAQKIGVAMADHPAGPFKDLGHALIDAFPPGVTGGQQIDPDVFTDPQTGRTYLFWGNGYLAGAELNDDMMSLKKETIKILTPDASFREGAHVFYRAGRYYFMWSEDDTRSPNYRVRYGTASSPLGGIQVPPVNLVIQKDTAAGIYGTGHNSVIKLPGRDEWYIVYHRFNYPKGITMGESAGYNREVCMDVLTFDAAGGIIPVKPTHRGISPVKIKARKN